LRRFNIGVRSDEVWGIGPTFDADDPTVDTRRRRKRDKCFLRSAKVVAAAIDFRTVSEPRYWGANVRTSEW
jgi:hypothetical protein